MENYEFYVIFADYCLCCQEGTGNLLSLVVAIIKFLCFSKAMLCSL